MAELPSDAATDPTLSDAWRHLREAIVRDADGRRVGTVAALAPGSDPVNYDQVFIRDFVPAGLAFLANGEPEIVRGFLAQTLALQITDEHLDCHLPGPGALPASFKIPADGTRRQPIADYGDKAIGRVAPADSVFWWLILLRAYAHATGQWDWVHTPEIQAGIRRIVRLVLTPQFDVYPALLVPEGSFMIDRRMGVYGYPLEIQVLLFLGLRAALELLADTSENRPYHDAMDRRAGKLAYYVRQHYWLDRQRLRSLAETPSDQYGEDVPNQFNINPDAIPPWIGEWLPDDGGYLVGNVGPGRIDFRFFTQGNLLAVFASLLNPARARRVVATMEARWSDFVGEMPLKILFPAFSDRAWEIFTGHDTKNTAWSYHNGGHWPVLLWPWTAACLHIDRPDLAQDALAIAAKRLPALEWPEYFDGRRGQQLGKQTRRLQTWSMAGFVLAHQLLARPERLSWLSFPDDLVPEVCPL